jgi:hypothetical protein
MVVGSKVGLPAAIDGSGVGADVGLVGAADGAIEAI